MDSHEGLGSRRVGIRAAKSLDFLTILYKYAFASEVKPVLGHELEGTGKGLSLHSQTSCKVPA